MVERDEHPAESQTDFAQSAHGKSGGLLREYRDLIRESRKYWLVPIILVLLVVAGFILLSGTVVAPLIYTLF